MKHDQSQQEKDNMIIMKPSKHGNKTKLAFK